MRLLRRYAPRNDKSFFFFITVFFSYSASAVQWAEVESYLRTKMALKSVPGMSIAVLHKGETLWQRGLGLADVENQVPATPESVYRLASVSKTLTATAIMMLAESGRLDIDREIQTYCPAFPKKGYPITARKILSHTSGIRHYRKVESPLLGFIHYTNTVAPLDIFKSEPLEFIPGFQYLYSTFGYQVLECAIEGASGRPFFDFLSTAVLAPTGMKYTRVDDVTALIPHRAQGYRTAKNGLANSDFTDTSYKVPGGGIVSTVRDMARFAKAILENQLLSVSTRESMFTEVVLPTGMHTEYGLGWILGKRRGEREVYHTGSQEKVKSVLYLLPEKQLAVIAFFNLEEAEPLKLARWVADRVLH